MFGIMNNLIDGYTNMCFNKTNKLVRINEMNVEQLRKYYKVANNSQLAKELKKGRSTIHEWELNGIPPRTQAALQVLTNGKLKADKTALVA